ncbi:MAG: HlyD family efflux transporter periplasmic adaptor subunit [Pirellulales bacterium]
MPPEKDYAIRELARLRLTVRSDLIFAPRGADRDGYYVIEDPIRSKFHRVGMAEYAFISLLDGQIQVGDALQKVARISPEYALSEQQAATICKWLIESELAFTPESSQAGRLIERARTGEAARSWQRFNPIVFRIPLLHPSRTIGLLTPWLSWIHSPGGFLAWGVVTATALYQIVSRWDRFVASSEGILAPGNWLWLLLSWIGLKIAHEVSHGVVCHRYGGTVREAGLLMILFAPIAYVDVTSSWRFRSKWQRIHTAAAGMVIEILIASLAALLWSATPPGPLNNVCHNVVIMAGLTTMVININPLMRFDGYYILSDLLEIPNLYGDGQQYWSYWARRYLWGMPATRPSWSRARAWVVPSYGAAAICWRIVISLCLVIGAAALFHGAGIVLASAAVVLWLGGPIVRCFRSLSPRHGGGSPSLFRAALTVVVFVAVTPAILFGIAWPAGKRAPAVVEYAPLTPVRVLSAGFIRELHVRSGQWVQQGQVLAVLSNDKLELEAGQLRISIAQSQLKCRMFKQAQEMAAYQTERKNLESLEVKRREKEFQVAQLVVRAPRSGRVIRRDLDSALGTYLEQGEELLSIGNEEQKEVRISVAQEDLDAFKALQGHTVSVHLPSLLQVSGQLERVNPRATFKIPHSALSAQQGGPLIVKRSDHESGDRDNHADRYELLVPRFNGIVDLATSQSCLLRAGQVGFVTVASGGESIGQHLYRALAGWLRRQVKKQR